MKWLVIIFIFLFSGQVYGQNGGDKDFSKKMKSAKAYFEFYDFRNALNLYKEIYYLDSLNGEMNYNIGMSIYNLRKNQLDALPYFKRAADKKIIDSYYYIGVLNHLAMKFDEAIKAFTYYKNFKGEKTFDNKEIDRQISIANNAVEMIKTSNRATIINMGSDINSKYADYVPLISADESVMIFTSRRPGGTGNLLDPNGEYFEDIYISYRTDTNWSTPVPISANINTNGHDACVALSPDGQSLFIYRTNEDLTAGDIYISRLEGETWSVPEILAPDINTPEGWEPSASITADEESFYFSSNRAGSLGEKDIYSVVKLPNKQWSMAKNLGPVINTPYDEDSPFIHPNGKTLYFSSKGHNSMGGYDIFKTKKEDNGVWSEPVNLGYPINTVDNDIYFVLNVDGTIGFYSSARKGGFGETDIYAVEMPENEFNLFVVSGFVYGNSSDPVQAKITLFDEETKEIQGTYKTNKSTGKYMAIVTPGVKYQMLIESDGYFPYSAEFNYQDAKIVSRLKKIEQN